MGPHFPRAVWKVQVEQVRFELHERPWLHDHSSVSVSTVDMAAHGPSNSAILE
jgi:hypothetical protein